MYSEKSKTVIKLLIFALNRPKERVQSWSRSQNWSLIIGAVLV
jgi:hypothetical protein